MNREIKFRVWNKLTNEMSVPPLELMLTPLHELLVPMQWTGEVDANGKEIYEGDIIAERDVAGHYKYIKSECVVIFENTQFVVWPVNPDSKGTQYISEKDVVIGNIFQDTERGYDKIFKL